MSEWDYFLALETGAVRYSLPSLGRVNLFCKMFRVSPELERASPEINSLSTSVMLQLIKMACTE